MRPAISTEMDKISADRRSANMAKIRSSHTRPEIAVRKLVYGFGLRYRLHQQDLPGKPDIVFRKHKKVIFVHGCFWHQHPKRGCLDARRPASNTSYWQPKLDRNVTRDAQHLAAL